MVNDPTSADIKLTWIKDRLSEGLTVYLSTAHKHTKITTKHLPQVRSNNGALEVQHGRQWLNHNYSRISAS